MDGKGVNYGRNGRAIEEVNYKNGRKDGNYIQFNERTGEKERHYIYENGMVLKVILEAKGGAKQ